MKSKPDTAQVLPQRTGRSWAKRILRHRLLSWTTLFLALTSYILTVVYLWHSDLVSRHTIFGRSPASALGTANVLSWTANTLLAASIGQSLELTRAMLVARSSGHCLLDDLPIQSGTGIDGLFEIIWKWRRFGRHYPGAWSIFRLMTIAVVPILGIIVLSMLIFHCFTFCLISFSLSPYSRLSRALADEMKSMSNQYLFTSRRLRRT